MSDYIEKHDSLSPEMAGYLEKENYATPVLNNKRKISRHLLSTTPSPPGKKVRADDMVELPVELDSVETLEFMGFTAATAQKLFAAYTRSNEFDPDIGVNLLDLVHDHIFSYAKAEDAEAESDNWLQCLQDLGVNAQVANGIMHPDNDEIRYAHSCKFWVERAALEGYAHMQGLDDMLWLSTSLLRSHSSGSPSQPRSRKESRTEKQPSPVNPPSSSPESQGDTPQFGYGLAKGAMPEMADHHTTLWRGGSSSIQDKFYDKHDGTFHMDLIASAPGDFGYQLLAHWTPQRECAEKYRRMTTHTQPDIETCIIQIAVPESVTNALSKVVLYSTADNQPNDNWRQVIWYGRNSRKLRRDLGHLNRDMMMGHIASGKHCKYQSMRDWTKVKISDRMKIALLDGTIMVPFQWVIRTEHAQSAVVDSIKDKVWFHKWNASGRKIQ